MQAGEVIKRLKEAARSAYDEHEAHAVAYRLLSDVYGVDRNKALVFPEMEVSGFDAVRFERLCNDVAHAVPVQYIAGHTEFCGLEFEVNPSVLIPRPETEELVGWVCRTAMGMRSGRTMTQGVGAKETVRGEAPGQEQGQEQEQEQERCSFRILDIGTGSGAIAVSLAHFLPWASVQATDIFSEALGTARRNAERNGVAVTFFRHDILSEELPLETERKSETKFLGQADTTSDNDCHIAAECYDIIVSNPPYIPLWQKGEMRSNVLDHEPHTALFVPDEDPLLFYRVIGQKAISALRHGGRLFFEINDLYGEQTCRLLEEIGFESVECCGDMNGKPRMIRCIKR